MKRWQVLLLVGFLAFVVWTAPESSGAVARSYGEFVLEGLAALAEFVGTALD